LRRKGGFDATLIIKMLEISVEIQSAHGDTKKASGDAEGERELLLALV
jgi:hypothetical protein